MLVDYRTASSAERLLGGCPARMWAVVSVVERWASLRILDISPLSDIVA